MTTPPTDKAMKKPLTIKTGPSQVSEDNMGLVGNPHPPTDKAMECAKAIVEKFGKEFPALHQPQVIVEVAEIIRRHMGDGRDKERMDWLEVNFRTNSDKLCLWNTHTFIHHSSLASAINAERKQNDSTKGCE